MNPFITRLETIGTKKEIPKESHILRRSTLLFLVNLANKFQSESLFYFIIFNFCTFSFPSALLSDWDFYSSRPVMINFTGKYRMCLGSISKLIRVVTAQAIVVHCIQLQQSFEIWKTFVQVDGHCSSKFQETTTNIYYKRLNTSSNVHVSFYLCTLLSFSRKTHFKATQNSLAIKKS